MNSFRFYGAKVDPVETPETIPETPPFQQTSFPVVAAEEDRTDAISTRPAILHFHSSEQQPPSLLPQPTDIIKDPSRMQQDSIILNTPDVVPLLQYHPAAIPPQNPSTAALTVSLATKPSNSAQTRAATSTTAIEEFDETSLLETPVLSADIAGKWVEVAYPKKPPHEK